MSGPEERRLPALDVLRAVAVFLVIGHHAAWRFRPEPADWVAQVFKGSGWIGVDIFFAISGFMITRILMRDEGNIRGFFVRRLFRIVPIFIVAIATFVAVSVATGIGASKLGLMWSPALMLNGWTIPYFGYGSVPYTITWSLSVEETAYLALGMASLAHRGLGRMLLVFVVLAPLVRSALVLSNAFNPSDLYFFVPARLDAIAWGGLAAMGLPGRWPQGARITWLAGGAMFALIWVFQFVRVSDPVVVFAGYSVFAVVAATLVSSLAAGSERRVAKVEAHDAITRLKGVAQLAGRAVAQFGKLSYFIYLFHIFVLEALVHGQRLVPGMKLSFWTSLVAATILCYALAAVSWKYFEYPLIQYGRRISLAKQPMAEGVRA